MQFKVDFACTAWLSCCRLSIMPEDHSKLRLSGNAKNFVLDVRGPGGVIVLVAWMVSVVLVATMADGNGRLIGVCLLGFFIAAYFSAVNREGRKKESEEPPSQSRDKIWSSGQPTSAASFALMVDRSVLKWLSSQQLGSMNLILAAKTDWNAATTPYPLLHKQSYGTIVEEPW